MPSPSITPEVTNLSNLLSNLFQSSESKYPLFKLLAFDKVSGLVTVPSPNIIVSVNTLSNLLSKDVQSSEVK